MKISLTELRIIINRLLDHIIEVQGKTELEIRQPFYWNLPSSTLYNLNLQSDELKADVGSLADDWALLHSLLNTNTDPVPYQCTEVAALIRFLGESGNELSDKTREEGPVENLEE